MTASKPDRLRIQRVYYMIEQQAVRQNKKFERYRHVSWTLAAVGPRRTDEVPRRRDASLAQDVGLVKALLLAAKRIPTLHGKADIRQRQNTGARFDLIIYGIKVSRAGWSSFLPMHRARSHDCKKFPSSFTSFGRCLFRREVAPRKRFVSSLGAPIDLALHRSVPSQVVRTPINQAPLLLVEWKSSRHSIGAVFEPLITTMGHEEITILTDEDSYGPTPPPPSHPHPDDLQPPKKEKKNKRSSKAANGGAGVQIQGIDDVFKHDPPAEFEASDGMETDEAEDLSVEIPPTTVVQRMLAKEEQDFEKRQDNSKWTRVGAAVCGLLVLLAIILGAGYGSGAFSNKSSTAAPSQPSGDANQDGTRPAAISTYLESVSTQGASGFSNATSPQTLSMNWLINDDPLQLSPSDEASKFRLAQRYALLTMWFSSKAYWTQYSGWVDAEDECTWFGVTCEQVTLEGAGDQNVVTQFSMDSNGVQALSGDLFTLQNLKVLSLADNVIEGRLPAALANASSLVELYLESNLFSQDLSKFDWSKLTNLEVLRLGMNAFKGTLHDSLWSLTNLQEIVLDSCSLSGEIPTSIASLENLVTFDISSNRVDNSTGFSGPLPTSFASLPKLEVLALGGNQFDGAIPDEYANFPALTELNLADNQLTGSILEGISALPLTVLRLGGNSFTQGPIPTFLYDMTTLQVLDVNSCQFDGPIDPAIANLVNLIELNVGGNFLTSSVPTEIEALSNLQVLQAGNNFIGGTMDFATALVGLIDLNVASNQLTGFPDLSALSSLQFLRVQDNPLATTFPESLTSIANLSTW